MSLLRASLFASFVMVSAACTIESSDASCPSSSPSGGGASGGSNAKAMPQGGCVRDRDIEASETWSPTLCPDGYLIKENVAVTGFGVELTVEPGTNVMFDTGARLEIAKSAALIAAGTPEKKIVFTGFQSASGTWRGIQISSDNAKNEIAFAKIEFAGHGNERDYDAALQLGERYEQGARLQLSDTEITNSARFGLNLFGGAKLPRFERVAFKNNQKGAAHVRPGSISQLRGPGIVYEENGPENLVLVETTIQEEVNADATWPNPKPAKYRVVGQHLEGGDLVYVKNHLTIEAGAIFEMAGGSGFLVEGGSSGMKVVGSTTEPVIFKGVADSAWYGITFGESTWSENRLENVQVRNASTAPSWQFYGRSDKTKAGILLGYNYTSAVHLTVKNLLVAGPNNAPGDIAKKEACKLVQEGANSGTGAGGALQIIDL